MHLNRVVKFRIALAVHVGIKCIFKRHFLTLKLFLSVYFAGSNIYVGAFLCENS